MDWHEDVRGVPPNPIANTKGSLEINTLEYNSRGFRITINLRKELHISCFNQTWRGPTVRDFVGKTQEGIKLGAPRDEVKETYGKPDFERDDSLDYVHRGWRFAFRNKKSLLDPCWPAATKTKSRRRSNPCSERRNRPPNRTLRRYRRKDR